MALRAQCASAPACLLAVSWLGWALYRNIVQPCLCSTVAIHLSVLRYNSILPNLLLQYNKLYCNIVLSQLHPSCNTIPQPSSLQYKLSCNRIFFSHNTIWAVALPNLHHFFFHYKYFFFIISNSWKIHKKKSFFIFFLGHSINF